MSPVQAIDTPLTYSHCTDNPQYRQPQYIHPPVKTAPSCGFDKTHKSCETHQPRSFSSPACTHPVYLWFCNKKTESTSLCGCAAYPLFSVSQTAPSTDTPHRHRTIDPIVQTPRSRPPQYRPTKQTCQYRPPSTDLS